MPDEPVVRQAGIARLDNLLMVGPWGSDPDLQGLLLPQGVDLATLGCTLAYLVAWPGFVLDYGLWARRLHAAGLPFALVLAHPQGYRGGGEEVGRHPLALAAYFPVEDPRPCWRCLELRYLGWSEDVVHDAAFFDELRSGWSGLSEPKGWSGLSEPKGGSGFVDPEVDAAPPPHRNASPPTQEQIVMLRWLAMDVTGADAGIVMRGAHDGSYTIHTMVPHPQCNDCSPWAGAPAFRHRLAEQDFSLPGFGVTRPYDPPSVRIEPPPEDRRSVTRRVFANVLPPRLRYAVADPIPYLHLDAQLRVWTTTPAPGLGHAEGEKAERLALLEAVAAYTSRLRAGRPMLRGTRRGIAASGLDPRPWLPHARTGSCDLARYREGREYDWVRGHALYSGDDVAVLADLVFSAPPWEGVMYAHPAGLVAHDNLEVAVRVALAQVAATDALMLAWYGLRVPPQVPWSHIQEPRLRAVLEEGVRLGYEMAVLNLTTDLGVPVLAVVGRHPSARPGWVYGCGCDLDPQVALERAFTSFGDALDTEDDGLVTFDDLDRLFAGETSPLPLAHPYAHSAPIDTWRACLRDADTAAFWMALTPPEVAQAGLAVVKVLIAHTLPGLDVCLGGPLGLGRWVQRLERLGERALFGLEQKALDALLAKEHPFYMHRPLHPLGYARTSLFGDMVG